MRQTNLWQSCSDRLRPRIPPQDDIWLSTVLRSIGDAVIACDADGRIVFMNHVAETLTGWSQAEAEHHALSDVFRIVHEETRALVESPVDKVRRLGTVVGLANHTLLIRRDGSEISIDDSGAPIHASTGELNGIVLIFRDISDRRRAERNLELLSDSGRAIAQSRDVHSTLENIARLAIRTFSDFCYFDLLREDGSVDRTVRVHRDPRQQELLEHASRSTQPLTPDHPVRRSIESGASTLIPHVDEDWRSRVALNRVHQDAMRDLGFHSLLTVPVRDGDRIFGTLSFCRTVNPAAFNAEDAAVAEELAGRVAASLLKSELLRSTQQARTEALAEREAIRLLFEQVPAPVLMLSGPEFRVSLVNDAYVRTVHRQSQQDLLGKTLREALPELEGQGFFELLQRVFQSGETYNGREALALIRDPSSGHQVKAYYDFVVQATHDRNGKVDGLLNLNFDITDQVRSRQQLQAQKDLLERQTAELETVYGTAPIGLALFDPVDYRFLRINDSQAEIVGLPAGEILGKTLTEIAPIEGLREMFDRVAQGSPVRNALVEGELPSQPGVLRAWTVNYVPVFAEDGSVQAITAASLEITAQRRAEKALIQSEKIAAVGRLASSIAHEINNPLEAVTNLLFLARQSESADEIHNYLDIADLELRRISLIASQTLRFYRQSTRPSEVTAESLATTVLSLYQGRLQNSRIEVDLRPWLPRPILCFEGEIRQVLNNLVGNALDAMPHGGRLLIRSREITDPLTGHTGLVLTFADTGGGIAPATLQKIFEPFFTTKGMMGTGLGLWISKGIVEKHHGTLHVRSAVGKGTVFRLCLPFHPTLPAEPN